MKKILTLCAAVLTAVTMSAQHEIGGIVGGLNGASYKYWFTDEFALQGDLAVGLSKVPTDIAGTSVSAGIWDFTLNPNAEYHWDLPVNGLKIYAGGGVNLGMMQVFNVTVSGNTMAMPGATLTGKFGINAIGGLCYNFDNAPLVLAFDFRPGYGLQFAEQAGSSFFDWKIAVAVRYCL